MSAPGDDALRIRRTSKIDVGGIEDDDASRKGSPPRLEPGARLPRAIARRIELDGGPAARALR
jgi:hypothetical protein